MQWGRSESVLADIYMCLTTVTLRCSLYEYYGGQIFLVLYSLKPKRVTLLEQNDTAARPFKLLQKSAFCLFCFYRDLQTDHMIYYLILVQMPLKTYLYHAVLSKILVLPKCSQSIHLHFVTNLSRVFPVLHVDNAVSCVSPQNKIGHHSCRYRQLMQVPALSARGT